jgi:hypothetical protein
MSLASKSNPDASADYQSHSADEEDPSKHCQNMLDFHEPIDNMLDKQYQNIFMTMF